MEEIKFNQEIFEYMDNLIDENCSNILRKNEEYVSINERISAITDIVATLPEDFRELFREYTILLNKSTSYEHCLLYHLRIKQSQK